MRLWHRCVHVGEQVLLGKRLRVAKMRVQRGHARGTFLDNPHARVAAPVNSALMSFWAAEESFQVEVVVR